MEGRQREVKFYETADGKRPFQEWLDSLRDRKAAAKIKAKLKRVEQPEGNLGVWKPLTGKTICELKVGGRVAYRVYFGWDSEGIWLLLGGKHDNQERDIEKAEKYWADHEQRKGSNG